MYSTSSHVLSHISDVAGITIFHLSALCIRATSTFKLLGNALTELKRHTTVAQMENIVYFVRWQIGIICLTIYLHRHFEREHFSFETYNVCLFSFLRQNTVFNMGVTRHQCRYLMHFDTFLLGEIKCFVKITWPRFTLYCIVMLSCIQHLPVG